jgi:hypothetical protein
MIVPMIEITMDPRQPALDEKKANMFSQRQSLDDRAAGHSWMFPLLSLPALLYRCNALLVAP